MSLVRVFFVLGALGTSSVAIDARATQVAQTAKDGIQEGTQQPSTPSTPPKNGEVGANEILPANRDGLPPTDVSTPSASNPDPKVAASELKLGIDTSIIPNPTDGKGQVIFYRPQSFVGMAISFKVRENGIELGTLSNGRYFVHEADPGPHIYVVHSETKDTLVVEVEPGESYFVQGGITMGVMVGRPNLSPSDQVNFLKAAGKMKRSDGTTD